MAESTKKTPATPKAPTGKAAAKPAAPAKTAEGVKIVDKASTAGKHTARAKPTLDQDQKDGLRLRDAISGRRPAFRRQQWYEYHRLHDSGWRRPTGVDSAMRRHFGYEQKVVSTGFRGPVSVRGLHPTGFIEVRVEVLNDLAKIDPKTQAARVSGNLGSRKLKLIYAEADKRGVRVLNRKELA